MSQMPGQRDRRWLLTIGAVMVVLVVAMGVLAPAADDNNPIPTIDNTGPAGAKAAYLLLQAMGRTAVRWEKPLEELNDADAAHTTLVLTEPIYDPSQQKQLQTEVQRFLEHGGRVLATGGGGGLLLADGGVKNPSIFQDGLCEAVPEGPGELAKAGGVEIFEGAQWIASGPQFEVEQRCNRDAVVVRYLVSGANGVKGEAIWWASATPLSNSGLKNDANLKLLLASVGDGRTVLFDESLHNPDVVVDTTKGLPLGWLELQALLLGLLLVFSFSRRRGPIRMPVTLPRSSPVEFAESMGDLYEKAGATNAATEAARRRLLRVLMREAGISQATVQEGPSAISAVLQLRLGGDWTLLAEHLQHAAETAQSEISPRSALTLVQALHADADEVRAKLRPAAHSLVTLAAERKTAAG
jgi:hypothetical protein